MEEDDHDDLLRCSDDDSMTENEEQCIPTDKQGFLPAVTETYPIQSKFQFLTVGIFLMLSSTFLTILLPLYLEAVNVSGDAYTLVQFVTTFSVIILIIITMVQQGYKRKSIGAKLLKPPIDWDKIIKIGVMYAMSGFMVVYSVDRKRVMCHLQDPIKGIVLVFSLVYYFFFCRKKIFYTVMGLQRIFSSTTIIVGLFISVDYGLCDEFRCRGMERENKTDDTGGWPWQTHASWAAVYICGLSLFSAHYTFLERNLIPMQTGLLYTSLSSSLLSTISKLVSNRDTSTPTVSTSARPLITAQTPMKKYSAFHISLWLHIISWVLAVCLLWTDIIPSIGKGSSIAELLNNTSNGFACHFKSSLITGNSHTKDCGGVFSYSWLFLIVYVIYSVSSIRFLIMSQSAVFTVAVTTIALPLTGIWWSVFHMTSVEKGLLIWAPSVTGELICSLLGLPIVLLGVILLFKSHFKETEEKATERDYSTASTQLA